MKILKNGHIYSSFKLPYITSYIIVILCCFVKINKISIVTILLTADFF